MNLIQFLERWPAKEGRLFFFAGGKDHDRLSVYYTVCDHWRNQVHTLDFVRLHEPSINQVIEACRMDPIAGNKRVVAATEMKWIDPDEVQDRAERLKAARPYQALGRFLNNFPRDIVLIMSTPVDSPLTKNDTAQAIIRKGFWTVLTQTDVETACRLVKHLTESEDDELIFEVVDAIGTSPANLVSFLRVLRVADILFEEGPLREYLSYSEAAGVFELTDAVILKNPEKALTICGSIPAGQFVGALDRKLTSLLQFMAEMNKGHSPKEAAMSLRLPGFIVHGLYEASKRWKPAEIISVYPLLAEHSVHGDHPGANDLLVRRLCGL